MTIAFNFVCELFQLLVFSVFIGNMLERKYSKFITYVAWFVVYALDSLVVYQTDNKYIILGAYYILMGSLIIIFYKGSIKRKILALFFLDVFMGISEFIVYIIMDLFFEVTDDVLMLGAASSKIVECILVRIVILMKKDRKRMEMTFRLWLSVLLIPISTEVILQILYYLNDGFHENGYEVCVYMLFLLINYMAFSMFDDIQQVMLLKSENKLLEQQRGYYLKQCEQVQQLWENMREFRHNITNQYISERIMLKNKEYEKLGNRYEDMIAHIESEKMYASTGNLYLDSLINYKLSVIQEMDAQIKYEFRIPENLPVNNDDMTLILGNLLDNAIDALKEVTDKEKQFQIKMIFDEPNLLIWITNTFEGGRQTDSENHFVTTKANKDMHGIGLKSVTKSIENYKGKITYLVAGDMFEVKVHMLL